MRIDRLVVLMLVVFAVFPAFGVDRTWTGSQSGDWSNPANWSPVGVPAPGERLEFPGNSRNVGSMNNDLAPYFSVGPLSFNAEAVLNGNPLTVTGDIGFVSSPSAVSSTINVDIRLANSITVRSAYGKAFNGAIDVNGKTLTFDPAYNTVLRGPIRGAGVIHINGTGLNIEGNGTFSGTIDGRVNIVGSYPNASVRSPRLSGNGSTGAMHAGLLYPGDSPPLPSRGEHEIGVLQTGSLTINPAGAKENGGAYNSAPKGQLLIDLTPGGASDQLRVRGSVALDATLEVTLLGTPANGQSYVIIDNDGTDAVTGRFTGLSEGAAFTVGNFTFWVTYRGGDGNDVVLNVGTPPPTAKTWTGATSANWSEPSNWSPAGVPQLNDALHFPAGARLSTNNDLVGFVSGPLKFDDDYTLGGNQITVQGDLLFSLSADVVFNAALRFPGPTTIHQASSVQFNGALDVGLNNLVKAITRRTQIRGSLSGTGGEFLIEGEGLSIKSDGTYSGRFRGRVDLNGSYPKVVLDGLLGAGSGTGKVDAIAGMIFSPGSSDPWSGESYQRGTIDTNYFNLNEKFYVDVSPTGADRVNVVGQVNLWAKLIVNVSGSPAVNQSWTIIDNAGTDAVYEHFSGLPDGSTFYVGEAKFRITYKGGDGNDVVLTHLGGTAAKAATTTTLTQNRAVSEVHQPVTFTARVTAASGSVAGSVTFSDGATMLGSAPLQNGEAALTTKTLSEGTHSIVATYSGADLFEPSASAPLQHAVVKGKPNVTVTPSASALVHGDSVNFRVDVASSSAAGLTPTGRVTLTVDGTVAGSATLVSGSATIAAALVAGSHTIAATYEGSEEFEAASASLTQAVAKAKTTLTLEAGAKTGAALDLAIRVAAADRPALRVDGAVVVRSNGQVVSEVQLIAGAASTRLASLPAGEHEITASFAGSSAFEPATAKLIHNVSKEKPALVIAAPSALIHGDSASFRVDVTSAGGRIPTGRVTLTVDGMAQQPATLVSGSATISVASLAAGSRTIAAAYEGDGDFETATGSTVLAVAKAKTSLALTPAANPAKAGTPIDLAIRVSSIDRPALIVNGPVVIHSNGAVVTEVQLTGGVASARLTQLAAGEYEITASFAGSDVFEPATAKFTQRVVKEDVPSKSPTSTTLTQNRAVTEVHQPVTFTATVLAVSGSATGTVTFRAGSVTLGSASLENGVAELRVKTLARGAHEVIATYDGNDTFASSASAPLVHTVVKGNPHIALTAEGPSVYGNPVSFRVAASPAEDGRRPAGRVTLRAGNSVIGSGTLADGVATIDVPLLPAGVHTITATYEGNDEFSDATATLTRTVAKASTYVSLDPGATAFAGVPLDLVIRVNGGRGGLNVDGSLTIRSSDGSTAQAVPVAGSYAIARIGPFEPGEYDITAQYSGSDNFEPATGALRLAVTAPLLSVVSKRFDEGNGTHEVMVQIELTGASTKPIAMDYRTVQGTATAAADYDDVQGTVIFAPGQTVARVPVRILGDTTPEPDETFTLALTNSVGARFTTPSASLVIQDDEAVHAEPVTYTYATQDGVPLELTYFAPLAGDGPRPLILWIPGDLSYDAADGAVVPLRLTARGYGVASIKYRPAGTARFPAQLDDLGQAVRWLRANAARLNVDPARFAAWGIGAGGHLATLLGTTTGPDAADGRVQAVVAWGAIVDPSTLQADAAGCSTIDWNAVTSPVSVLLGCAPQGCSASASAAAADRHASASDASMLLMHGANDCFVSARQSERLHTALRSAGADATLRIIDGVGHDGQFWLSNAFSDVQSFLDARLKPSTRRRTAGR